MLACTTQYSNERHNNTLSLRNVKFLCKIRDPMHGVFHFCDRSDHHASMSEALRDRGRRVSDALRAGRDSDRGTQKRTPPPESFTPSSDLCWKDTPEEGDKETSGIGKGMEKVECVGCRGLAKALICAVEKVQRKRERIEGICTAAVECESELGEHTEMEGRAREQVGEALQRLEEVRSMLQTTPEIDREELVQEMHYLYCGMVRCREILGEFVTAAPKKPRISPFVSKQSGP